MAIITQTRIWNNVPTKVIVDTSTGETKVYPTDAAFQKANPISAALGGSPPLLASSSSNEWAINASEFSSYYNNYNPNKPLTVDAFNRAFQTAGRKVFDNDRAAVFNNPKNYDGVNQYNQYVQSWQALGIPRIKSSITGVQTNSDGVLQTNETVSDIVPPADQQGGYSEPPSDLDGSGSFDFPSLGGNVKLEGISPAATPTAASAVGAPAGSPSVLRYPLANLETARELGISYDYIKIRIVDYIGSLSKDWFESRGLNADTFYLTPEGTNATVSDIYLNNQRTLGYVILPMQPNISSANSTDWGSDSANILQLVAGGLLNSYFSSVGNKGTINTIRDAFTKAAQSAGVISDVAVDNKSSIAALLAGYIANTSFIQRTTGTVINPNMEMLFNGPRLRSFNFTFDMVPRFREEAETVRKIIKTFKKYMAPEKTAGNAFLKAPKIFLLDYIYNGDIDQSETDSEWSKNSKQHPYLNKIKPCALTDFNVNYTPAGSYMTYRDGGSMTSYQINMTFSEVEPVYQDDIDINSNDMGY